MLHTTILGGYSVGKKRRKKCPFLAATSRAGTDIDMILMWKMGMGEQWVLLGHIERRQKGILPSPYMPRTAQGSPFIYNMHCITNMKQSNNITAIHNWISSLMNIHLAAWGFPLSSLRFAVIWLQAKEKKKNLNTRGSVDKALRPAVF